MQGYNNRLTAMNQGFWLAIKTFKGPCFGCDSGIKRCHLLLTQLGPKSGPMIASILVINKFNQYNKENFAEAICNSAQFLICKYMDCRKRIIKYKVIKISHG